MNTHRESGQKASGNAAQISLAPVPGILQRQCACGGAPGVSGECESCQKNHLQRGSETSDERGTAPPVVHRTLRTAGESLDKVARVFFETQFGHDFSRIRIHADDLAAASAAAVGARAFTVGDHIAFGAGQFSPQSAAGRRLLAHELTHTIQQERNFSSRLEIVDSTSHEQEAERAAEALQTGHPMPVLTPQRGGSVARDKGEPAKVESKVAKCPKSHTIPDDVYDAIGAAWKKSGHGGKTVAEHGGRIVTDSGGKRVIRTGGGGRGSISLPDEKTGDVTQGTFHTHPYSKAEDSELNVSFSGGDISNFVAGGQGSVKYIGAGGCYFVLDTLDQTQRDACKKVDLEKRWDDGFAKASGSFQKQVETAVKATIAGCGLCYYRACRANAKSPVPKSAALSS